MDSQGAFLLCNLGFSGHQPNYLELNVNEWVFLQFLQPTNRPNFLVSLGETTVNIRDVLVIAAGLHLVLMFGTPIASGFALSTDGPNLQSIRVS